MTYAEIGETQRANHRYLRHAMALPMLDPETEFDLARRWREDGDEDALHSLTTAYMRLVISIATRFRNYGLPYGDLVQEGNVGLMQAAARFEPAREVRFSTYASWWIRAAIQDYILRNWSIVRTGTTAAHKSLFFNLRRLRALISNGTRQTLNEADRLFIARKLGVNTGDVETMEARLSAGDRSLNATIGDGGPDEITTEWVDLLPCDRPLPEEEVIEHRDHDRRMRWIEEALRSLTARELTIIRERRLQEDVVTLEMLGERLGISKERVRQIEHHAMKKIKASLLRQVPDPQAAGLIS